MRTRIASLGLLVALVGATTPVAPWPVRGAQNLSARSPQGSVTLPGGDGPATRRSEVAGTSVHAQMLAEHAADAPDFTPGAAPRIASPVRSREQTRLQAADEPDAVAAGTSLPNGLRKEVFGFLPYWMLTDGALSSMNYNLVSTVAYFSVGATRRGGLSKGSADNPSTGWAGWTSSAMTGVIDRAHAEGVKVVLTVTMMAWDGAGANRQAELLTSSARRTRLVNKIVDAVQLRSADGVNLDFEPLATSLRDEYVLLVRQLKAALGAAGAGDYVSVCVMASAATWATGYDVAGLTAAGAADHLFVMGYDYNWSGSSRAGGVAPIQSPYSLDVDGTMLDFLSQTSGSKLIWGVPYYGRIWPTTTQRLNASTLGWGSQAYSYLGHLADAERYGRRWDDVGKVPWYRYWDGSIGHWVQGYYDDRRSLGVKYDLINARGLAGTGMWTLLMDRGRDELWQLLADKFVSDTDPPVGGVRLLPEVTDSQIFKVSWAAVDYGSGIRSYNVQVRRPGLSWQSWLRRTTDTSAWYQGDIGSVYRFRVQAVDRKGNAQQWITIPAEPPDVETGAFARVQSASLNVRTGPGTAYGIVAQAVQGERVYVLEGPVAGDGLSWYRVQYGFAEWPSAAYPQVGWMAAGTANDAYLVPAPSPNVTEVRPFVSLTSRTVAFSPNGDGIKDGLALAYRLRADADTVRLDILDERGSVVRTRELGPTSAGAHTLGWNGRTQAGAAAPEGRYLTRLRVTDASGDVHFAPSRIGSKAAFDRWATVVDVTAPRARPSPRRGEEMVSPHTAVAVAFHERVMLIDPAAVQLRRASGRLLEAAVAFDQGAGLTIDPAQPLPADGTIRVLLGHGVQDRAGNPAWPASWSFRTSPGQVYDPLREVTIGAGERAGYRVDANGDLLRVKGATLRQAAHDMTGQRAVLPNLPGRWLHLEDGTWAGYWMRETGSVHILGRSEVQPLDPDLTVARLRAGTHVGVRFDAAGGVSSTLTVELTADRFPRVSRRTVVNGRPYLSIASGPLRGYRVRESNAAYLPGYHDRLDFAVRPRVRLDAGRYDGRRYETDGRVRRSIRVHLEEADTVRVASWAVINGVPRYLIAGGSLGGYWVAEKGTRLIV